ncbi:YqaJ viral recombinase family protein [Methylomarinum vadi]
MINHAQRLKSIGASEAAAAIGINPYCTQVDLWMEKTWDKNSLPPMR